LLHCYSEVAIAKVKNKEYYKSSQYREEKECKTNKETEKEQNKQHRKKAKLITRKRSKKYNCCIYIE
jgi:hypothetical protein